jgi:tetratricopeptide (TPR) repeat protein
MASSFTHRGDAETTRHGFEKAIESDSAEVEPLLNLGVLYDKAGDKPQALRYYQQLLAKTSPKDCSALIPEVRAESLRRLDGLDHSTTQENLSPLRSDTDAQLTLLDVHLIAQRYERQSA